MKVTTPNTTVVFEGVNMTADQRSVIEALQGIHSGGIGTIVGYVPSTGYSVKPVKDVQIITAFSTERLYQRKLEALQETTFEEVLPLVTGDNAKGTKLEGATTEQLETAFNARKQKEMDSVLQTLEGDRSGAHREAHDRNYKHFGAVKVNFVTKKNDEGKQVPVIASNGLPTVESILVPAIEVRSTTRVEGEYKNVNSGIPVLVGNAIKKAIGKKSLSFKQYSLKENNFESFRVSKREIVNEDVNHLPVYDILM